MAVSIDNKSHYRIKLIKGNKESCTEERQNKKTTERGYEAFGPMNYKIWKQIEGSELE